MKNTFLKNFIIFIITIVAFLFFNNVNAGYCVALNNNAQQCVFSNGSSVEITGLDSYTNTYLTYKKSDGTSAWSKNLNQYTLNFGDGTSQVCNVRTKGGSSSWIKNTTSIIEQFIENNKIYEKITINYVLDFYTPQVPQNCDTSKIPGGQLLMFQTELNEEVKIEIGTITSGTEIWQKEFFDNGQTAIGNIPIENGIINGDFVYYFKENGIYKKRKDGGGSPINVVLGINPSICGETTLDRCELQGMKIYNNTIYFTTTKLGRFLKVNIDGSGLSYVFSNPNGVQGVKYYYDFLDISNNLIVTYNTSDNRLGLITNLSTGVINYDYFGGKRVNTSIGYNTLRRINGKIWFINNNNIITKTSFNSVESTIMTNDITVAGNYLVNVNYFFPTSGDDVVIGGGLNNQGDAMHCTNWISDGYYPMVCQLNIYNDQIGANKKFLVGDGKIYYAKNNKLYYVPVNSSTSVEISMGWNLGDFDIIGSDGKNIFLQVKSNNQIYRIFSYSPSGDSNGNYSHYILNRLTASEGNMQYVNNSAGSTSFSNSIQVKSNFLANYSYMQTWYEAKGLTLDVINNNVDWDNGVTFSKTDVANGMLAGYKLSAHYQFMSYKETDNHDSSIFWRTNLESTSFQTDTTWTNVGLPVYPIRNGSGGIVAYLEFPCGNLICKDQYCSDVKKIITQNPINPIKETVFADPGNGDGWCGDGIKNTMEEECDGNDGIKHDLGETCNAQCKVETSPGITPGCPLYSGLGYICSGATPTPIFGPGTPVNQPPVPTYSGFGIDKNTMKNDTLTATDTENDTLTFAKFSDPAHGTVNILPNGSFTYTPSLNYIGNDSFFYSVSDGTNPDVTQEVSIVINDVVVGNNPPVPTFTTFSVAKNSTKNDTLTATDIENDTLSFIPISTTTHGDLVINNDGTFTYTPNPDYSGTDTFTYAVSDGHNLPVNQVVNITVIGGGGNSGNTNTGTIIDWTPPGSITLPNIGDINTNTGMTDTEKTIANDVVCSVLDEGFKVSKSIIVTNTMADTSFISRLKGKDEFLKTLSGSSLDVAEKVIGKKIKTSKLNQKSNLYDFGSGGTISGIQFNLSEIPDSAVMRKLVDLAIDHSSTTMADYEQTVKDSCNNSSVVTGKEVVPVGFIDVNEKGQTILNLFRYNGE